MRYLWCFAVIAVILTFSNHIVAEENNADQLVELASIAEEPATLIDVDTGVKDEGELNRETRQFRTFGFGRPRPFYGGGGGGFYRPRPYYGGGGGFYRPRPYYGGGGGFYRPRPYYGGGGFYRPPPFYGGFYG